MKVSRIPVGCPQVDEMLSGGIECGIITEIYGEGGSGKTNFCLMLAKSAVSMGGKVIYIDTEGVSPERMSQIFGEKENLTRNIYFRRPKSFSEQYEAVIQSSKIIDELGASVIIVDSLTQFYRMERGMMDEDERGILSAMLNILMLLAREKNICVLVTNQVYTDKDGEIKPIGGHALSHAAKTIIWLRKLHGNLREAVLIKHRSLPQDLRARFQLTDRGME